MTAPGINCVGCAHWMKWHGNRQPTEVGGAPIVPPMLFGYCRRHAPRIQLRGSLQVDPFPTTTDSDVCGDFETLPQFVRRVMR